MSRRQRSRSAIFSSMVFSGSAALICDAERLASDFRFSSVACSTRSSSTPALYTRICDILGKQLRTTSHSLKLEGPRRGCSVAPPRLSNRRPPPPAPPGRPPPPQPPPAASTTRLCDGDDHHPPRTGPSPQQRTTWPLRRYYRRTSTVIQSLKNHRPRQIHGKNRSSLKTHYLQERLIGKCREASGQQHSTRTDGPFLTVELIFEYLQYIG